MSGLQGYAYLQRDQLEELKQRLEKAEDAVDTKVDNTTFMADVGHPVNGLDAKNSVQQGKIAQLKMVKADKVEFNSRVNQLSRNDTRHDETMNQLEIDYSGKVSQLQFNNMVAELRANDASQDARLDVLEQQFDEIQVRIKDEIVDKANELVATTDFNAMIATLQAGDTGLHNQIIQLASAESINNALTSYQTSLSNLQGKTEYDAEIGKLVNRHLDFEKRLMAVDQFFKVMGETYKLYNKNDVNKTQIPYTAIIRNDIPEPPQYEITGYESYIAGSRGFGFRSSQFETRINITFTEYGYNTLTGEIKLYDSSNNLIGSISQSDINSVSKNTSLAVPGAISSLGSLAIKQTDSTGEMIKTVAVPQATVAALPNITPIRIIESSLSINGFTSQNVSVSTLVEGIGMVTFTPALPTGLSHTFTNNTLTISGSVSSPISPSQTYTLRISNGTTADEIPVNIQILPALPGDPTNLVATAGVRQVSITFTAGSAGGSPITNYKYSVDNGVSYTAFSPAYITSPVVITNLANGTTYQIKLRAVNSGGDGAESTAVSATTPNLPSALTNLVATKNNGMAIINFTAGADGGSPITNYKYSINNGTNYIAFSPSITTSPLTITGLTNGVTYQIRIRAVNAVGDGPESATMSVTPSVPSWAKLGPDIDGKFGNEFSGTSVSLSADGTIVAIGAPRNFISNNPGCTRVYIWDSSASQWVQRGNDINGEAGNDMSGQSVSLSDNGNVVAIGAPYNDGTAPNSNRGHVRIYDWNNSTSQWVQRGNDIDGETAGDNSGQSVSLSANGNVVAIGAPYNNGTVPDSYRGHVRVYVWNSSVSQWVQRGADIDGEATNDWYGIAVSLSTDGNTVAIGGRSNDGTVPNSDRGHVRIYDWNSTASQWAQRGNDIDGEASFDYSGCSVSLSANGNTVAIGSGHNDGTVLNSNRGHVRIYDWNISTAQWAQRGTDIDGEDANDYSGWSVSLSDDGNTVAIGAPYNDGSWTDGGHVRVYTWSGSAWVQRGIDINGESQDDWSGSAVSLSADGTIVAIGAPQNDGPNPSSNRGHVRVYRWS
jgi:hypothetical protein